MNTSGDVHMVSLLIQIDLPYVDALGLVGSLNSSPRGGDELWSRTLHVQMFERVGILMQR